MPEDAQGNDGASHCDFFLSKDSRMQPASTARSGPPAVLPGEPYVYDADPEGASGGFDAIAIRAKHVHEAFAHSFCKDQPTGWVISEQDFFSKNFKHSSAIVTQSGEEGSPLACNYIRPSGLYLSILTKGAYFLHAEESYEKLSAFMEINRLAPDGDVFLFPIISYWATNDPDEYINSLSVKVKDAPPILK